MGANATAKQQLQLHNAAMHLSCCSKTTHSSSKHCEKFL